MTFLTILRTRDIELSLFAERSLFKRDFQIIAQIIAALRTRTT